MGRKAKEKQAFRNEGIQGEFHKEGRYCGQSWLSEHNFWRIWRLNYSQKRSGDESSFVDFPNVRSLSSQSHILWVSSLLPLKSL